MEMDFGVMKRSFTIILLLISCTVCFSQRYATASGAWNGPIWATTPAGVAGSAATPTASDDVFTNGFNVFVVTASTCRNLFVDDVTASGLQIFNTLTVTGTMLGHSRNFLGFGFPNVSYPTTTVIAGSGTIEFTGSSVNTSGFSSNNEVIHTWSSSAPIINTNFNFTGTGRIGTIGRYVGLTPTNDENVVFSSNVNLNGGTLETLGTTMNGFQMTNGILTISSSTTLTLDVPLTEDGLSSSRINALVISGNLDLLDDDSYANSENFTLNSGATLDVQFIGSDQDEGWWANSDRPTTFSIDPNSTITFGANINGPNNIQNIYPTSESIGSLILSGTATKALVNNVISLNIDGDLSIASGTVFSTSANTEEIFIAGNVTDDGGWTPTQQVIFDGTSQTISGISTIVFNGGLRVNGATSTTLTLSNIGVDINGTLDIDGSATFDPDDQSVTLAGDLINDGTLNAGTVTSTFTFDGVTSINGSGSTNFNNLVVSNTLTSSSGTINVAGDFTNNNIFNRNNGTVNFNGTGQDIAGTVGFENININGTVTNTGTIQLYGTFTPVTGSFNTGNDFTVMSTNVTGGDGRIAEVPGTGFTFTGNLTVQRYVDGIADGDWRYLSSPVVGATLNDWLTSGMPITGSFSDASPAGSNNVVNQTAPSVYIRNSAAGTWDAVTGANTSAVNLENGTGYSAYTYVDGDLTLSVTGQLPGGTVNVPLAGAASAVDPFYLVGNPYPSPVDWDNVRAANTSLGATVYIREGFEFFAQYNAGGGSINHPNPSWAGEILAGQSFWVDSSPGATSVSFTQSMKSPVGTGQFLRKSTSETELVRIKLSNEEQSDETVIFFHQDATDTLEFHLDGVKQLNGVFSGSLGRNTWVNLSSYNPVMSDTVQYSFNAVNSNFCTRDVHLNIRDLPEGDYELELNKYTLGAYTVSLVDSYQTNEVKMTAGGVYSFQVTNDVASYGENRFKLVFEATPIDEALNLNTSIANDCDTDYIEVLMDNVQDGVEYKLQDSEGNDLSNPRLASGSEVTLFVNKANLKNALNTFSVFASTANSCSGDITYPGSIEFEYDPKPAVIDVQEASKCLNSPGPITLRASGAPADGYYRWYDGLEVMEPIDGENQDQLVIEDLAQTKWYYVSAVNAQGCESERRRVSAEIIEIEQPELLIEGQTLIAPEAESYQWYRNKEPIEGAQERELTLSLTGDYQVEVFNRGCSAFSETRTFVITSVDDELYSLGLNVYPNPVMNKLNFDFFNTNDPGHMLEFVLFDLEGRVLKTEENIVRSGPNNNPYIPLNNLDKGMYILNIKAKDKIISLQIIKM